MTINTRPIVKIKRLTEKAKIPQYATPGSAGMDLHANLYEEVKIRAFNRALIPTGIAIEIPPGYEAQVRSRSGLALKVGLMVLNSPGTIDSDYRGEVCVILQNTGTEPVVISDGDRIAQLVIAPVIQPIVEEVVELSDTQRGSGGFGSSGTK